MGASTKILETLTSNPNVPLPALSTIVYGNALPETVLKLKHTLWSLARSGKVRKLGASRFEVV